MVSIMDKACEVMLVCSWYVQQFSFMFMTATLYTNLFISTHIQAIQHWLVMIFTAHGLVTRELQALEYVVFFSNSGLDTMLVLKIIL